MKIFEACRCQEMGKSRIELAVENKMRLQHLVSKCRKYCGRYIASLVERALS